MSPAPTPRRADLGFQLLPGASSNAEASRIIFQGSSLGGPLRRVVVSASPVTGDVDKTEADARVRGRASRAHELLTLRAREVFAAAAARTPREAGAKEKEAASEGSGSKRRVLVAIDALVSWLDDMHDVFVAPDPSNFGRIFAPDPHAGGALVPSRLLGGPL